MIPARLSIRPLLPIALLAICIAALYVGFLHSPVVFDDLYFFHAEALTRSLETDHAFSPRWLPYASFGATYQITGLALAPFRIGNLLLHIGAAWALMGFLRRLWAVLEGPGHDPRRAMWLAFFAALLFAVHPVAVYGPAYLVQRSIVMATFFVLLMWTCFLRGATTGGRNWLALSVLFYALALHSKEHAIMAPAAALAMVAVLPGAWRETLRRTWPVFAAWGVLALETVLHLRGIVGTRYEIYGAEMLSILRVGEYAHPLSVMTQATLFFKYLGLWLLPNPLWMSVDMRVPFAASFGDWRFIAGTLGFIAYGVIAVALLFRPGRLRLLGLALLLPWLLFFTEFAAVRIQEPFVLYRSYLWMPGLLAALPLVVGALPMKRLVVYLAVGVLFLAGLSFERLSAFSHPYLLWDDAAKLVEQRDDLPGAYRIFHNRGISLARLDEPEAALKDFDHALRLNPDFGYLNNDRGAALLKLGRPAEAIKDFERARALVPNYRNPLLGLARAHEALGHTAEANRFFRLACRSGYADACKKAAAEDGPAAVTTSP